MQALARLLYQSKRTGKSYPRGSSVESTTDARAETDSFALSLGDCAMLPKWRGLSLLHWKCSTAYGNAICSDDVLSNTAGVVGKISSQVKMVRHDPVSWRP